MKHTHTLRLAALALAGALILIPPARAGFDEGMAAYQRGDYATALKEWRPLAEQGDATAQYNLGVMYRNGQGVPQDYKEAVKWYRMAAEQGHAFAQNNLGVMYDNGLGVTEDKVLAYALYNLSAAADSSPNNKAQQNRDRMAEKLTKAELMEGQALTRELAKPGNFAKALDAYLAKTAKKAGERAAQERKEAQKIAARAQPPAATNDPFPPRPDKVAGRVSCSTRCVNADCWRTYDDGRKVKFRAKQKWNPFDGRFEWDAGPC